MPIRRTVLLSAAIVACGFAIAVRSTFTAQVAGAYSPHRATLLGPVTRTYGCVARAGLPDRRCTPGAIDPRVTQGNLDRTICRVGGYTRSVRPPESYTRALKRTQIAAYGEYAGARLSAYEEDHLVSLELGGSPDSPANLWPEAHAGVWGSFAKDRLENLLHRLICSGRLRLAAAQRAISANWEAEYRQLLG